MLAKGGNVRAGSRGAYRAVIIGSSAAEPGNVYELTVDLWSTSIVLNRGHKIRVAVSSSNFPRFDPNPNTGRPFRVCRRY